MNRIKSAVFSSLILLTAPLAAEVVEYDLTIEYEEVNYSGKTAKAMTINGHIPGPVLRMKEGDIFRARVHNKMDVETSIHWHGLLVPNFQDGVPYVTTPPIEPGTTFTYEFPIRHSGTYWYHSHTGLQEQRGVYGPIVIEPKGGSRSVDRDYVLVFSDWTDENPNAVLRTLKRGSHYYSLKKGAMPNLWDAYKKNSLWDVFLMSLVAMPPMEISDVAYDAFLINGRRRLDLEAKPGETVRLRMVNAAASTYFYYEFAGGPMEIVAADGVDVEPFQTHRVLMAIAETYDVILKIPDEGAYEFRITAQDGSGTASAFIGKGPQKLAKDIPPPNIYKMIFETPERPLPPYDQLRSKKVSALPAQNPTREVHLKLTGDMERYVWSFNGKTLRESDKILIKKGENVRFIFDNKTMMHHPLHLHGHFFRVVNSQGKFAPLKHTVDIPPLSQREIEFEATEDGDWFFHCHILYHMKAGMTRVIRYEGFKPDPRVVEANEKKGYPHKKDYYTFWGETSILSHMTDGHLIYSGTRNRLRTEWEAEWDGDQDESYDVDVVYERYFNRFLEVFVGVNPTEEESVGIFGLSSPLPLNIDGEGRVDTEGEFRLTLEKELHIIDRLKIFGHGEFNSDGESEGEVGLSWTVSKAISLVGQTHSEYGTGAGIKIRF